MCFYSSFSAEKTRQNICNFNPLVVRTVVNNAKPVNIDRFQSRDHFTIGRHIGAHVNSELVSREL